MEIKFEKRNTKMKDLFKNAPFSKGGNCKLDAPGEFSTNQNTE